MNDDSIAFLDKSPSYDASKATGSAGYQDNFTHRM